MNSQPTMQPKPSANGFGRRRVDRDTATRSGNRLQPGKTNSGRVSNAGAVLDGKVGGSENASRDRLLYLTTCLIGHPVEVQVKNGSVYAGLFHATDAEKDFGIILKSARLVKDGTLRGQKATSEFIGRAASKTLIISAKELVQVIAKDVAVTSEPYTNEIRSEKMKELMTDSNISQSRHVELGKELAPWIPDVDDPECPELENIFDNQWNRGWDQFEANEVLFGVKTTYDEELYTTKLEKGPQMRELEREAIRIAREIEGEKTQDLHVAEERGIQLSEKHDVDEETRYSSVHRHQRFDDSGYDEDEEDILLESRNSEALKSSTSTSRRPSSTTVKNNDGGQVLSTSSSLDGTTGSRANVIVDKNQSCAYGSSIRLPSDPPSKVCPPCDSESRLEGNLPVDVRKDNTEASLNRQTSSLDLPASNLGDSQSMNSQPSSSEKVVDADNVTPSDSSCVSSETGEKPSSSDEPLGGQASGKTLGETQSKSSSGRPGSSTSVGSEHVAAGSASSGPRLSPSSSVGSLSSEKSSLNPNAKEFKLNPNAKSFTPSHSSVRRPPSPVSDGSFYYPSGISPMPALHGMSVGFGMGPSFPVHQPVLYNPQIAPMQAPQTYFHPNAHQYGQQMLLGQPRQVVYMPTYQPEMPYKG